jgi:hypothetical protein
MIRDPKPGRASTDPVVILICAAYHSNNAGPADSMLAAPQGRPQSYGQRIQHKHVGQGQG